MSSRAIFCAVLLATTGSRSSAQTLSQSDLVLGQIVSFNVDAAPPGSLAIFLYSVSGLGAGTCYPAPINVCLGMLEPVDILAIVPVDGAGKATLSFPLPGDLPLIPLDTQALVLNFFPQISATKTNAIEANIVPLSSLSDLFDGATLSSKWSIYNPSMFTYSVSGGSLHMQPTSGGPAVTWYADGEGPLVYKDVTGDFTVSTVVRTDDANSTTQAPPIEYRLGGLTVRNPSAPTGQHNWLHVTVGSGVAATPIAVEDKSTVNSSSDLILYPIAGPRGEIRITRQGPSVSLYYRDIGAPSWRLLRTHNRPDLPATLQVGLNVFSWQSPPSVRVHFERIDFTR